jgi:hypothetical protein
MNMQPPDQIHRLSDDKLALTYFEQQRDALQLLDNIENALLAGADPSAPGNAPTVEPEKLLGVLQEMAKSFGNAEIAAEEMACRLAPSVVKQVSERRSAEGTARLARVAAEYNFDAKFPFR